MANTDNTLRGCPGSQGARGFLGTPPDSTSNLLIYKILGTTEAKVHTPAVPSLKGSTGRSTPVNDGRCKHRVGAQGQYVHKGRARGDKCIHMGKGHRVSVNTQGRGAAANEGIRDKVCMKGMEVQGLCSHGRVHKVYSPWFLGCVKKDSEALSGHQTDQNSVFSLYSGITCCDG